MGVKNVTTLTKDKLALSFKIINVFPFDPEISLLGNSSNSYYLNMDEMTYAQDIKISAELFSYQKIGNNTKNPSVRDQLNKLW